MGLVNPLMMNSGAQKRFAILLGLNSTAQMCFVRLARGTWVTEEVLDENAKRNELTEEVLYREFKR
jgi:hypothetical protein